MRPVATNRASETARSSRPWTYWLAITCQIKTGLP